MLSSADQLTYWGLIVFLLIAIALNVARWCTEDKDRRDNEPDEHEDINRF